MNDRTKQEAIRRTRRDVYDQYQKATKDLLFTKDFNSRLDALVHDSLATIGERVFAYILRRAWGEYALFAVRDDGEPLYQRDVVKDLGLRKESVSKAVTYLQVRGYLEKQPKLLVPIVAPELDAEPPPAETSPQWASFVEGWKVAHSTDFERLNVARSVVSEIRKVMRSDYKKLKAEQPKADATLCKTLESNSETPRAKLTPYEENELRRAKTQPAENHPVDAGMQLKALSHGRAFLFGEIERMQRVYKNTAFANPPIDRENRGDQATVDVILSNLGSLDEEHLVGYVVYVAAKFKGIGKAGTEVKPRAPGKATGPTGLGLLVMWAKDYGKLTNGGAL